VKTVGGDSDCEMDFYADDHRWLGGVVSHPRIFGHWLAMWSVDRPNDCGMKHERTWIGAVETVRARIEDGAGQ
jgi:hypothetical protein